MDKKNLKKTEQPDRKQDKKDMGDLKKVEKQSKQMVDPISNDSNKVNSDQKRAERQSRNTLHLDTNNVKLLPDRGDLKKEKQDKKVLVVDTTHAKILPDRGDLKKTVKMPIKLIDLDTNTAKVPPDRGDLKNMEKQANKVNDFDTNDPKQHPDRGDSGRKVIKVEKPKLNVIIKKSNDKTKILEHHISKEDVKKPDVESPKTVSDDRRKIREKYNLKLRNPVPAIPTTKKEEQLKFGNYLKPETRNDRISKKPTDAAREKSDNISESKQLETTINVTKTDKKEAVQRRPIIRTISSKNDTSKIYKAVTFVEQRKSKPTTLQINIPNENPKNPKNFKSTETMAKVKTTLSGDSVKEKTVNRKKTDKRKRDKNDRLVASPDLSVKLRSPPTEVAKWAPSSINQHTKPYYEAWVSTTLAAISANSKKDKLFLEKQNILQKFQRALAERPVTPELVYENFTDERYTGRIKVKQR